MYFPKSTNISCLTSASLVLTMTNMFAHINISLQNVNGNKEVLI